MLTFSMGRNKLNIKLEYNLLSTVYKSVILVLFVQEKLPEISHPPLLHLFLMPQFLAQRLLFYIQAIFIDCVFSS